MDLFYNYSSVGGEVLFKGERVFELLAARGMTMKDLSEKIGVSRGHLSHIANNKKPPSIKTVSKIAQGLGVKEDYFYWDNVNLSENEEECYYDLANKAYKCKVPLELLKSVIDGWERTQKE